MANRIGAVIVVLVMLLGAVLGCQNQPAPAAPATQAPAAAKPTVAPATQAPAAAAPTQPAAQPAAATPAATAQPLKIGIAAPITGISARQGQISQRYYGLGVDAVNAKGINVGGKSYRFDPVYGDEKYTADGGREVADRLVLAERVKIILGMTLVGTPGAQPITEPNKVLLISSGASDLSLGPKFPYTLVAGAPHQKVRAQAVYDWLVKARPEAKRVAVLGMDSASGRSYATIAEELANAHGLTVVISEFHPTDLKDFNPLIIKVLAQKPDVVDIGATGTAVALYMGITKALAEQSYKGALIGTWGTTSATQAGAAGEGFVFPVLIDWKAPVVPQMAKDVIEKYIQKYGEADVEPSSVLAYNSPWILAQAMAKAGTVDDTEKLANTLRAGEWDTVWGKARFSGEKTLGLPSYMETPVFLTKVEGGKLVTFDVKPGLLP